jgi:hypothetical protein
VDDDQLFLETLNDLEPRLERGRSEYEVLAISMLLRLLILDNPTLLAKVNRSRPERIRFVVNARDPVWKLAGLDPPIFWSIEDGFDPDTAPVAVPLEVTLDELLGRVVMTIRGLEITVKDVIRQALYVSGGAHPPRPPETAVEEALANSGMFLTGYPAGLSSLLAIGRVVVKGLAPLRARVEGELASSV